MVTCSDGGSALGRYRGAGVLPVCRDPDNPDSVLLLLQQRTAGKQQGFRCAARAVGGAA